MPVVCVENFRRMIEKDEKDATDLYDIKKIVPRAVIRFQLGHDRTLVWLGVG
jgi:hypothetical protein